jgi:hypothetical protein
MLAVLSKPEFIGNMFKRVGLESSCSDSDVSLPFMFLRQTGHVACFVKLRLIKPIYLIFID